jgi:HAD superfamily hydrolase (TIGR01549 family)
MTPDPPPRRGVLFDLDGTLVDTNYPHVLAWWRAFRTAGYDVAMADIHRKVGMGADLLVSALIDTDDEQVATGHRHYYAPHLEQLAPFPGATELLRAAARLGLEVVLASSAEQEEVDALTAALGADDVVSAVTSSADAEASKPAPDILDAALSQTGLAAADCVLVGDTVWDVKAAAKAGMPLRLRALRRDLRSRAARGRRGRDLQGRHRAAGADPGQPARPARPPPVMSRPRVQGPDGGGLASPAYGLSRPAPRSRPGSRS